MDKINKLLTRSVQEIIPGKEGLARLLKNRRIRLYLGIDPTGTKLHLGHTIPLKKLQEFADLDHEAILLIGTGTVLAGDPSQKATARQKITQKEIDESIKTWKSQTSKIIDFDKIEIKYNGDWLLKLGFKEILTIASKISATQLLKREMFQERLKRGDTVWTHEMLYPLLQGYDSVVMNVDLEIGGTDQIFNMLIGRELQKKMNNREKYVLATPLINGVDGKPMSKSSNNCIWIDDQAGEMFGKIMSIADDQIDPYWQYLTDLPQEELKKDKPIVTKKKLAKELVRIYHGSDQSRRAEKEFENVFQKHQKPQLANTVKVKKPKWNLVDFLAKNRLAKSRSEAKRLVDQKAIEVNGKTVNGPEVEFKDGQVIRIGKKKFVKVSL